MGEHTQSDGSRLGRYQFSLWDLCAWTTVAAFLCAWFACPLRTREQYNKAADPILALGGSVLLGKPDEGVAGIKYVRLPPKPLTDSELKSLVEHLKTLPKLEELAVQDTQWGDAELRILLEATNASELDLGDTQVTDAELELLASHANIEVLWLDATRVTDDGLDCLKSLRSLRMLCLDHTEVTESAVRRLQEALPNCFISDYPAPFEEDRP